jgi:hypothetical protein
MYHKGVNKPLPPKPVPQPKPTLPDGPETQTEDDGGSNPTAPPKLPGHP